MTTTHIKTTKDGRAVTLVDGVLFVGDEKMHGNLVTIKRHIATISLYRDIKSKDFCATLKGVLADRPEITHVYGMVLLTADEASRLESALADQKAEKDAKQSAYREEWESKAKKVRVLARHGAHLLEESIFSVVLLPDEEQKQFKPEYRKMAVVSAVDEEYSVRISDSPTAQTVKKGSSYDEMLLCGEGVLWEITPEQEAAILAECRAATEARSEAKQSAEIAERERVDELFVQAKATGEPQKLDSWVTDVCADNLPDCSFDTVVKYAMPDGSEKIVRSHCY